MTMTEADLRTLLDTTHDAVVTVFSAVWCGPCRAFAPIFTEAEKKLGTKITFAKMDVDECTQLCEDLTVGVVPTIIVFRDCKAAARHEGGFADLSHFINWLNAQGVKGKK